MKRIEKHLPDAERYRFDFGKCSSKNGFSQMDTDQDAPYYGTWGNPTTLTIINYAEGDYTEDVCENQDEFRLEIKKWFEWQTKHGWNPQIDCYGNEESWKKLGFELNEHSLIKLA